MIDSTDEKHLLIDLKDGSFQALERLHNMYNGKLYDFIMRLSSGSQYMIEEVVQATLICIWEVYEKVGPASSFISFLYTIAEDSLINMCQHQAVEYVYNKYFMKSGIDRDLQTEENIDLRFLNEYIDSLAEELPAQRKKIFVLNKRQNYTNKGTAEIMGVSESTVAAQLSLTVEFMREQLMKYYDKVVTLLLTFFVNEM